jgi:hypothetical protein
MIIRVLSKTCNISSDETSFNDFFDKHYIEIIKAFNFETQSSKIGMNAFNAPSSETDASHIKIGMNAFDAPSETDVSVKFGMNRVNISYTENSEKEYIKNVLNETHRSSLKTVFTDMIKNPENDLDHICDIYFECICPVICNSINFYRQLQPYLNDIGIVQIPFPVSKNDLLRAKGDYFISGTKIYKKDWLNNIVEIEYKFIDNQDAVDHCISDSYKPLKFAIVSGVILGGCLFKMNQTIF